MSNPPRKSNGSSSDFIPALDDHFPVDAELTPQPQSAAESDPWEAAMLEPEAHARTERHFLGRHPLLAFVSGVAAGILLAGLLRTARRDS